MKKIFLVLFSFTFFMFSCSTTKKANSDATKEQEPIKVEKTVQQSEKDKQKEQKLKQKQKEKELKEKRKNQKKEQERLSKEAEQKKKASEKEAKRLKKEQENLIKNAEKKEKNRIKEERKKEKEALEKSQKELTKKLKEERERAENEISEIEDEQEETITQKEDSIAEKIEGTTVYVDDTLTNSIVETIEETENPIKQTQEERELSTMEQILSMMEANPRDKSAKTNIQTSETNHETETIAISDKEKKSIIKQAGKEEKEGSFIKRMYRKVVPEKVDRDVTYPNMYKEQPNSILVLYPWNRSQYDKSSEMLYVSVTKELIDKGYYVLPAMFMMDECKKDTNNLYSRYAKLSEIKKYKEKYGVDAVLFVTIYRFEKPWWTTNITAVAHYNLISTITLDTLFSRQADFNYDSQMPPKNNGKDKLIQDEKEQHYLGIMEQMQRYVFLDMPVGPYHKNYSTDQKKFSHKKEMKYKVNVKPS